jgi:hypothetical protein
MRVLYLDRPQKSRGNDENYAFLLENVTLLFQYITEGIRLRRASGRHLLFSHEP